MNITEKSLYAAILIGIVLLCAFPTMWLWNWLMPDLFHLPEITLLQALGLQTLAAIFFKK